MIYVSKQPQSGYIMYHVMVDGASVWKTRSQTYATGLVRFLKDTTDSVRDAVLKEGVEI